MAACLGSDSEVDASSFCHSCELRGQTQREQANLYFENCRTHSCDICLKHKKKKKEIYCRTHGVVMCELCKTLSHNLCKADYIPEVSEQFVKGKEYLSFEENVNELKERCAIGMSKIEANMIDIEETSSNIISSIENIRKEITESLDRFEDELKEEVTEYKKKNLAKMEKLKNAYETIVRNMTGTEDEINELRRDQKYNSLFCEFHQAFKKVSNFQSKTYELSTKLCIQECRFQKNEELTSLLKKKSIFGIIHVKDTKLGPCNIPEKISKHPICHINIKSKDDKQTCQATGLAFISCYQLAVADKANKKVKIVDVKDEMIAEIKLSSSPRDITVIPPDQLAVTLRDEKIIQILSTASSLRKKEEIKVNGNCRGIKCVNGNLIVTFDGFALPRIQEMTTKGEVLRTIEQNDEGRSFLGEPKCIGLTPDQTHMYVTDLRKKLVYRLSESRKLTASSETNHYVGIAVSGGGSVYASSKTDNAVFQLTDDLSGQRVVLCQTNGIRSPVALAISHEKNILVVSCGSGAAEVCDKLHLFKITRGTN